MPKTAQSYVPDSGELVLTITADDVTAITKFVTAESITLDGAVRSFKRTQDPERETSYTRITGDNTPITHVSNKVDNERWELVLVDDYSKALTGGEWGTDTLSAVEFFDEFYKARRPITTLAITPAGGVTGAITYTLSSPIEVVKRTLPEVDADSDQPATVMFELVCPTHTTGAHA